MVDGPVIGVALKVVPLRVSVDPLTGLTEVQARSHGCSRADEAALERALRLATEWGAGVLVASAGDEQCMPVLRNALAVGAAKAVHVPLAPDAPSAEVARAFAAVLRGCTLVLCGDHSLDRGSGSVPAFLAHELGVAQALGLTELAAVSTGKLDALRRLDGGRRERLSVGTPAVVSVETGSVRLRRAALSALLAAGGVRTAAKAAQHAAGLEPLRLPYRPRAKALHRPPAQLGARQRILDLTGALVERTPPKVVRTDDPAQAADELLEFLTRHGYLP